MNNLKNRVQLIGHLGNDPEMKTFDSGKTKASLSIATNESYKNAQGDKVDETTWHNVVAWGKTAELASQLMVKGKEVALEGKLSSRKYDDKDGNTRYVTEVVMSEFLLLGKKN